MGSKHVQSVWVADAASFVSVERITACIYPQLFSVQPNFSPIYIYIYIYFQLHLVKTALGNTALGEGLLFCLSLLLSHKSSVSFLVSAIWLGYTILFDRTTFASQQTGHVRRLLLVNYESTSWLSIFEMLRSCNGVVEIGGMPCAKHFRYSHRMCVGRR